MSSRIHSAVWVRSLPQTVQRRIRGRRGEDGYVLMFVMGIIAMTSLLVVALLGLALTSARIASEQSDLARETRAADGALEAAVARIEETDGDPCEVISAGTVQFAVGDVQVDCSPAGVPNSGPEDLAGPDVEIVGTDAYGGLVTEPDAPDPAGLVYNGSDPLRFDSDVYVATGAAVSGDGPAVDVVGQYRQGDPNCTGVGGTGANQIADHDMTVECGIAPPTPAAAASWSNAVPPSDRLMDCGSGPVRLVPGTYSRDQVEALASILSGTNPCVVVLDPGVHYLDVYDGSRPEGERSALTISNPNLLLVGGTPSSADPSSAEFPYACDTGPGAAGVQIVLSARTAIRHTAGQVALCPARSGNTSQPAIVQTATVNIQPGLLPGTSGGFAPVTNLDPGGSGWATAELCWAPRQPDCAPASIVTRWRSAGDAPLGSANLRLRIRLQPRTGLGSVLDYPASYYPGALSVTLQVENPVTGLSCSSGELPAGRTWDEQVAYDLLAEGGNCDERLGSAEDLDQATITATFRHGSADLPGSPWTGLKVLVRDLDLEVNSHAVGGAPGTAAGDWSPEDNVRVGDGVVASVSQGGSISGHFLCDLRPGACGAARWVNDASRPSFQQELALVLPDGLEDDDPISSLQVEVRSGNAANYLADADVDGGSTTFTITKGSSSCSATWPNYQQSAAPVRYDLIEVGPGCGSTFVTAEQLDGATLTMRTTAGCLRIGGQKLMSQSGTECASVAIPQVDYLGVVVGTDAYHRRPPHSSITIGAPQEGDPSPGKSFDVFGPVVLPRSDLDIHWEGATYDRPLFSGGLELHGLGSDQTDDAAMGSVCCVPMEGAGVLTASLPDGTVRAQAVVQVVVDGTGDRRVEIADWRLCGRGGCST